jgi:chromosome segregation ATPase
VQNTQGTGGGDRRDALRELQAKVEAAIDEARPKVRRALDELDARVDAAMAEIRPRAQSAMEEVKPKVDQFVADVQPRLDSVLSRLQSRIEELRRDLDERAARTARRSRQTSPSGELPPAAGTDRADDGPAAPGAAP